MTQDQDVNLFDFESSSGQLVMKEIKEDYYCLNFQNRKEENLWSILAFRLLENNDIELKLSIQSGDFGESGAYYEGVTDYRKAPEEMSDHAYILNPSAFEFISLINADDFFETIHLRRKNKN